MYSEILKIIEGGIKKDHQKVINYSTRLSQNLEEIGEDKVAKKILRLIESTNTNIASLDSLISKPFDNETKLETISIKLPVEHDSPLFFNNKIENEINNFVMTYYKRDILISKGIETNNNLLLYGPPGTGKTSVAEYISCILDLPLIIVKLDNLISSMLGSTAKNIRKVFEYASQKPCVLFLDEFDVLAKIRDDQHETGELKRVVNSLIQNIDEFSNESILVAATNHHQLLDKAIWRRFDKILLIDYPDEKVRLNIIKSFLSKMENTIISHKKNMDTLVQLFEMNSPSEIKTIINGAMKKSILDDKNHLEYIEVLNEIYLKNNPSGGKEKEYVEFLYKNGVKQNEIFNYTNIPIRKIRNYIVKEIKS